MLLRTIQTLIKEKKLRKNALAEQIGVSPVTLTRNLNGTSEMQISTLEALIKVIGEREVYSRILDELETVEWVVMDNMDGLMWGVFLINDVPTYVGHIEKGELTVYVKDLDNFKTSQGKLRLSLKNNLVRIKDVKEDTNIVNMYVYQYRRKSGD